MIYFDDGRTLKAGVVLGRVDTTAQRSACKHLFRHIAQKLRKNALMRQCCFCTFCRKELAVHLYDNNYV